MLIGTIMAYSHQSRPSGEESLHHALLEGAGFVPLLLQRRQFQVHVGENGGDGGLFGEGGECERQLWDVACADAGNLRADGIVKELLTDGRSLKTITNSE